MKRILTVFTALVAMAQAEIPAVAFKDVTKHFKDKHYSPVIGRVALDSGLIYNLRHFGPFTPAMGKNPDGTERRLYDSDKPQDAMMTVLLKLFPSSAGPLASESTGVSNFGKTATIQDVADMLRFAQEVRAELESNILLQRDPSTGSGKLTVLYRQYQNSLGALRDLILNSVRLEYNPKGKSYQSKGDIKQNIHIKKIPEGQKRGDFRREELNEKFDEIEDERLKDIEENRLYSLYTTEQIILAFFVHKFNDKTAIYELMQALGEDFVTSLPYEFLRKNASLGGATNAEIASLINKDIWTLKIIESYSNKTDLDFLFISTYHDLNAPIPFRKGSTPINNGNCPYIQITEFGDKKINTSPAHFADCHETAIRQLFIIGLYDAEKKTFRLPESIQNQYLTNFFDYQKPVKANDGSSEMRGQWNLVVAGIPGVRYRQNMNEIDSGFINLIKAMRHILDVRKNTLPTNEDQVIQTLKELFQKMNPSFKEVLIQISDFTKQKDGFRGADDEVYGNALITITNAFNQKFSFTLRENRRHSDIHNLSWEETTRQLAAPQLTNDAIFNLVDQRNDKKNLHKLLAVEEFADEWKRINRIKDFNSEVKQQHLPIINRMMDLTVDDEFNMEEAFKAIKPILDKGLIFDAAFGIVNQSKDRNFWPEFFIKHKDPLLINLKQKGSIFLDYSRYDNLKDNIEYFKKVELSGSYITFDLSQAALLEEVRLAPKETISDLILPNTPALKRVLLRGYITNGMSLDLSAANSLEEFLIYSGSCDTLTLPNSLNLKTIMLGGKIKNTPSLDLSAASALENVSVTGGASLEGLTLPNSRNLKTIILTGKITNPFDLDLSAADGLEKLELSHKANIGTLILPSSRNLKTIILRGTIENSFDLDLSAAAGLENLKLSNNANIGTLILPSSPRLKDISLGGKIETADLSQAIAVEQLEMNSKIGTLTLPKSEALQSVYLDGEIENSFDLDLSKANALEYLFLGKNSKVGTLTLPASKRALGNTLDNTIVRKIVYVNPDGSVVDSAERVGVFESAVAGASQRLLQTQQ